MRAGWLAFVSTEITQLATVSYTMLTGLRVAVCLILLVFRPVRGNFMHVLLVSNVSRVNTLIVLQNAKMFVLYLYI